MYLNDGQGVFNRRSQKVLDKPYSGKCVTKIDYDRDGDIDILIGNRIIPQSYPIAAPSLLLENENGMLVDRTKDIVPQLAEVGIVNDIVITDLNGDGWDDFITVGEWTGIHRFRNDHGVFVKEQDTLLRNLAGWWLSIQETDVNSDGKPDFVVGNVGENIKHKASKDKPFKVYANDFDNTGNLDIVLSSPYKGEYVPVRGRECSSQQMPMIAEKFKTYSSFAQASLVDIYGEDKLTDAYVRQAVTFKSILLLNNGEGDFTIHNLPHYAQMFPLLDMVEEDLNQDGFADLIIAGCIYDTEVETPRLDNGHGLVLLSNKSDGYFLGDQDQYRIFIPGDVKSLQTIAIADEEYLLAAKNDDVLSIFKVDR
ncbi:MAG: VCBS repeat-containing protein [Saprospiraceae bacterium]|nr:VCBS repeat-containing protein [Saprospiraceae bacterium]